MEGKFHVHTWSCVYGEIVEFPVILRPNATRWLILELRQHRPESDLTTAAKTSEMNLFSSKRRTVIADSLIWLRVPVWWMCWWMHRLDNKRKVRENNHCLPSDKQTHASWAIAFFYHPWLPALFLHDRVKRLDNFFFVPQSCSHKERIKRE